MRISRRTCLKGLVAGAALSSAAPGFVAAGGGQAPEEKGFTRLVRFSARGRTAYGILEGSQVRELAESPFRSLRQSGEVLPLGEVKLLAPCEPSKVLALAGNYRSHLADQPVPRNPELFIKAPSALLEPEGAILIPRGTSDVHYEGELVVVMGKRARGVSRDEALAHVFGYACGNDVSARDWQKNDRQWWRAKACDTFAPLGPWIAAGVNPSDLLLTTRLNGREVQRARTSELIFDVPAIVAFVSEHMTLLPGDLIYTGTPGQTSAMKPGDVVEVEIEKLGTLRNRVG